MNQFVTKKGSTPVISKKSKIDHPIFTGIKRLEIEGTELYMNIKSYTGFQILVKNNVNLQMIFE